jgi:hypothetical protein
MAEETGVKVKEGKWGHHRAKPPSGWWPFSLKETDHACFHHDIAQLKSHQYTSQLLVSGSISKDVRIDVLDGPACTAIRDQSTRCNQTNLPYINLP